MAANSSGRKTPEQACEEVWAAAPNKCNVFVQLVAQALGITIPLNGTADDITNLIANWPKIDPGTTMMSIPYTSAMTYAARGDFVIAGATSGEISNSISAKGKHHAVTLHGHVAIVTGVDSKGNLIGYSKALHGTPHKKQPLSVQFPASMIPKLHYFVVLRGGR